MLYLYFGIMVGNALVRTPILSFFFSLNLQYMYGRALMTFFFNNGDFFIKIFTFSNYFQEKLFLFQPPFLYHITNYIPSFFSAILNPLRLTNEKRVLMM